MPMLSYRKRFQPNVTRNGGEQEIRTLEGVAPLHAFQAHPAQYKTNPKLLITQ